MSTYRRSKGSVSLKWPVWTIMGLALLTGAGVFLTAAHLEESDAFCASCHSQPETTFFTRTLTSNAVDLASMHHGQQVKCIDCHSGAGVLGRMSAMSVGANDLFHFVTGTAQQPAVVTVPISDVNCLKCHAQVTQTRNFNRHFHAFLPRWQAQDKSAATCVDCHSAHTTDGNASLSFLQQQRAVEVCQRCHSVAGVE